MFLGRRRRALREILHLSLSPLGDDIAHALEGQFDRSSRNDMKLPGSFEIFFRPRHPPLNPLMQQQGIIDLVYSRFRTERENTLELILAIKDGILRHMHFTRPIKSLVHEEWVLVSSQFIFPFREWRSVHDHQEESHLSLLLDQYNAARTLSPSVSELNDETVLRMLEELGVDLFEAHDQFHVVIDHHFYWVIGGSSPTTYFMLKANEEGFFEYDTMSTLPPSKLEL